MKLFISPWRSSTPRALSRYLGTRLRRLDDVQSLVVAQIVNWGCSSLHGCSAPRILNKPASVTLAANKLACLQVLNANKIPTLEFTGNREIALDWNQKSSVIAHMDVRGHSGSGLTRLEPKTSLGNVPYCELYTRYFQKDTEVRILCIKDGDEYSTMFLEKKRILPERYKEFGLEGKPDWFIRTHHNGWIFSREATEYPEATALAKTTVRVLGLDFGAVDILVKKTAEGAECRVGEVNTAPGLEGQTLEFFKTGLTRLLNKKAA